MYHLVSTCNNRVRRTIIDYDDTAENNKLCAIKSLWSPIHEHFLFTTKWLYSDAQKVQKMKQASSKHYINREKTIPAIALVSNFHPTSRFPSSPTADASGHNNSLLNRYQTRQNVPLRPACVERNWGLTDNEVCVCGDIQTMSHIVDSCLLTKLDGWSA